MSKIDSLGISGNARRGSNQINETYKTEALPKQLSVRETSLIFNIPIWTLRSYISKKKVPHRRLFRKIYIPTDKFVNWLSQFDVNPIQEHAEEEKSNENAVNQSQKRRIEK